jgi:hypothetical protein
VVLSLPLVRTARTADRPEVLIGLLAGTARLQLVVGVVLAATAALA